MNFRITTKSRIGEKYNAWTVIGVNHTAPGHVSYICRCACGFEKRILFNNLKKSECCNFCQFKKKAEPLIGQIFGKSTVIGITKIGVGGALNILCSCGKEYPLRICDLNHSNKICKCRKKYYPGAVIDGITFLKRLNDKKFQMKCVCGNIFEKIPRAEKGILARCGCLRRDKYIDLAKEKIGNTYLKLKINKLVGNLNGHFIFEMKCKCGNTFLRENGKEFKSGSCGCLVSDNNPRGEKKGNSKLSEVEVISMRELHQTGEYDIHQLGKIYNISSNYVSRILGNYIWKKP